MVDKVDRTNVTLRMHADYKTDTQTFQNSHIHNALKDFVPHVKTLLEYKAQTVGYLNSHARKSMVSTMKRLMPGAKMMERRRACPLNFDTIFRTSGISICLCGNAEFDKCEDVSDVITLGHQYTCDSFRFTYALCYYSAQGTTIRDTHVIFVDTHHTYFNMRHLDVGLSRARHGKYVHVPSDEQEKHLM